MKGYCVDRDFSEVPLANVRSAQTHGGKKYFLARDLFVQRTKNEVDRGVAVETATSENPANVCSVQLCLKKNPFYEGHPACHVTCFLKCQLGS